MSKKTYALDGIGKVRSGPTRQRQLRRYLGVELEAALAIRITLATRGDLRELTRIGAKIAIGSPLETQFAQF